ncbi:MAG: hypothetical protein A2X52_07690 [Candidatus Rokubacteria bacterium GWC2_70_16]|nr:MAG: hypothetical protein A2X52_07690 [Candidatus Rokubacteria bacterium GWC2_70_16]OGL20723.1 MAG: hypothetical protein A3K12_13975 [Candidatus Rokubacteria bacterium RIFCSPLOWO2_12_FULL_71_19]
MQALSGIRFFNISQVRAAPATAKYLADHGADVIKVGPLGGDEGREPRAPADRALAMRALQPLTAGVDAAGTGERPETRGGGSQ